MDRVWENGDVILKYRTGRDDGGIPAYVWRILEKGRRPFLEARKIRNVYGEQMAQGSMELLYRLNGCISWGCAVKPGESGVEFENYVHIMLRLLQALELAEDQLIPPGSFRMNGETVFYHKATDSIRFAYIPQEMEDVIAWGESNWQKGTGNTGMLLLECLGEVEHLEPGFRERWPHVEESYLKLARCHAGRNDCIKLLKSWEREFSEAKYFRRPGRNADG